MVVSTFATTDGEAALFRFDHHHLARIAQEKAADHRAASPVPHMVLDDLFPPDVLEAVIADFPADDDPRWFRFDSEHERKLTVPGPVEGGLGALGDVSYQVLQELNGEAFVSFLATLTGIDGLVPDPALFGGGLHQILPGGHLDVHVDFNRHPVTGLQRRLNVLVYLNHDWSDEWQGHFELWDAGKRRCVQRYAPSFNRTVVFELSDRSFHGHPTPLACPPGRARRSLAMYYYATEPAGGTSAASHNTRWEPRQQGRAARAVDLLRRRR